MQYSTSLITQLIAFIEEHEVLAATGKAIRAYDAADLPVPINETYYSFSCAENAVTYTTDDAGNTTEHNKITIRINCFSPLKKSAHTAHNMTEALLARLGENFRDHAVGFEIGDTQFDDDVKAYKVTGLLYFAYESALS